MFHFIKKKPFLRDLIPPNHVDIHSHLLPGIDDGAQTFDDTLHLIKELHQFGIDQFITTPHIMKSVWDNTKIGIENKLSKTIIDLKSNSVHLPLRAAAEYLLDSNLATLFQNETLLVLKDNYVLVEMSYLNAPIQLHDIIFEIQLAGYKPVLAHPERYTFYHYNFKEYENLKRLGCLFQLNLLSTVGYYGLDVAGVADKLLKKGLIDFVGSDVHHQNHINSFSKKIITKEVSKLKEAFSNNQLFKV